MITIWLIKWSIFYVVYRFCKILSQSDQKRKKEMPQYFIVTLKTQITTLSRLFEKSLARERHSSRKSLEKTIRMERKSKNGVWGGQNLPLTPPPNPAPWPRPSPVDRYINSNHVNIICGILILEFVFFKYPRKCPKHLQKAQS